MRASEGERMCEDIRENGGPAGYIDSVYCGSGVDGAGLRCVVFFSGCNLRCPFCHNPETLFKKGERTDAGSLRVNTATTSMS